jgi:hypothetical protein
LRTAGELTPGVALWPPRTWSPAGSRPRVRLQGVAPGPVSE